MVTTRSLGRESAPDYRHLLTSTELHTILVSHNRTDYRLLHGAWLAWTAAWNVPHVHAGILILPHGHPEESARLLDEFAGMHGQTLPNGMYEYRKQFGWIAYR